MLHCFPLDNTEYEADALGAWFATRTRGVLSSGDNFAVIASGTGMSVTLQPGYGWLRRNAHWGTVVWMEEPETFILDPADGTLSRIDVVVLRLDKDNNAPQTLLRKGAFSNAPTFTAPVRDTHADEIYVASILVQPGAVKILQADTTDLRMDENVCGIMRDGITGIPTAQLQAQVQQLIDHLRAEVDGIEQGSEVMLKTVYDADGDGVVDEAEKVSNALTLKNAAGEVVATFDGSEAAILQLTAALVGALGKTEKAADSSKLAGLTPVIDNPGPSNRNSWYFPFTGTNNRDGTRKYYAALYADNATTAGRASNLSMGLNGTDLWVYYS